jgi:hypothetical protein
MTIVNDEMDNVLGVTSQKYLEPQVSHEEVQGVGAGSVELPRDLGRYVGGDG